MPEPLPAISLVAVPGRRRQTLDIAREIERRGFSGIYMPSRYSNMAQCMGLALATERIRFGTAIAPIYSQTTEEFAAGAAYIHEVSGGRFRFGIGVAHGPTHQRLGITPGKPLADTRAFVEKLKSFDGIGPLPSIVLAALALHRRRLERYVLLPNYRNYWKEAGYGEEMTAIEDALAENRRDDIEHYLTDRWIADNTLYGPAAKVRDRLGEWYAAGLNTPVLVPNSVNGNQLTALDEIFTAFAN